MTWPYIFLTDVSPGTGTQCNHPTGMATRVDDFEWTANICPLAWQSRRLDRVAREAKFLGRVVKSAVLIVKDGMNPGGTTAGRISMERGQLHDTTDAMKVGVSVSRDEDSTTPGVVESYDEAFWRLIRLAHQRAFRILGVAADSEDVASETLARASLRWARLEHPADAWVSTVATRLAIDRQRKAWRNIPLPESDRMTKFELAGLWGTPDGTRVDTDQRLDLARALAKLPKRQREVLSLAFLSGFTEAEIAQLLGCSSSSVQTHKQRGLARLRTELGDVNSQVASTSINRSKKEVRR